MSETEAEPKKLTREQVEQIVREARKRGERPNLRFVIISVDLFGEDRIEAIILGADLSYERTSGIDLSGADLSGADLSMQDLRGQDLSKADLSKADLSKADLSGTNLSGANLSGANLNGANLRGADLRKTDLKKADLKKADLKKADLKKADLRGADLSGTNLKGADLTEADLRRADLIRANLSEADLSGADLSGAEFSGAKLWRATLMGANLSRAYLIGADLRGVDLSTARLGGAYLRGAHLRGAELLIADLRGADLSEADLSRANFTQTKLDSTNFSKAILADTIFAKVDLSQAKGLTDVDHRDTSIIDINTIYQSKDKIPKEFLEGAGVHPDIIRWQHSLHTRPTVFISYSHQDEKEKDQLLIHLRALEREDLLTVWHDELIGVGADWKREIKQAIAQASVALLLITPNFLASDFIREEEIPEFLKRRESEEGLIIFPVIAKPCAWPGVGWLSAMQVRPKGGKPIWRGRTKADAELSKIAGEVVEIIKDCWLRSD